MMKFTAWTYDSVWTNILTFDGRIVGLQGGLDNVLTPFQRYKSIIFLPLNTPFEILIYNFKIESELIYFILKIESSQKLKEYTVQHQFIHYFGNTNCSKNRPSFKNNSFLAIILASSLSADILRFRRTRPWQSDYRSLQSNHVMNSNEILELKFP